MLDSKDKHAVETTAAELRGALGESLDAVVLWGEAATDAYAAGRSPLSLAVIVDAVTPDILRKSAQLMKALGRRRVDTLFFDHDYLSSARDVFPLELLDLADRHLMVEGRDPFVALEVDLTHLRLEVEQQLRGKMLHLWDGYLATAARPRALAQLLLDSPPGFQVIGRGMLRLRNVPRPTTPDLLLEAVEAAFAVTLPTLRRLSRARLDGRALPKTELEALFSGYTEEVRALVERADKL